MTAFVQVYARSPYRLATAFDATFGGIATAATYTLTRQDGVGTLVTVTRAWTTGTASAELALSEALLERVVYVLAAASVTGTVLVSFVSPLPQVTAEAPLDDPEAEAFGVDIDWLADALDASGDIPTIRGRRCLQEDLVAIWLTEPGELIHRPTRGAGLDSDVNGPGTDLGEMTAKIKRESGKDPRVKSIDAPITIATTGEWSVNANVTPRALNTNLPVTVHG
jgi:hypothetical protein